MEDINYLVHHHEAEGDENSKKKIARAMMKAVMEDSHQVDVVNGQKTITTVRISKSFSLLQLPQLTRL